MARKPKAVKSIAWTPQPGAQATAIDLHWVEELAYMGSVGSGKSDFLLADYGMDVPKYGKDWHGVIFRKTYPSLEELINRSLDMYPAWLPGAVWKAGDKTWQFPNGATLRMRFAESDDDWMAYQGFAFQWIGWDEGPQWATSTNYMRMKARLRSAADVPTKRIRITGNPGGPGQGWIVPYFGVDKFPDGGHIFEADASGMRRVFVRAGPQDNKILLKNDPGYLARLQGLGSPELVRQWLEGDFTVTAGAFFSEFSAAKHVVRPFAIPDGWTRFRAADWGSAKPFSIGWYAVASDDTPLEDGRVIPRGALIKYREWYGVKTKPDGDFEPDVGLKLTADAVGAEIAELEKDDPKMSYGVLDPAAFAEHGGPSIAETLGGEGVHFHRADNTRVGRTGAMGGWDLVRSRLVGDEDGRPMIYFFNTCRHTIRTFPLLQHDSRKPEDAATNGEDHALDETRYACASRPFVRKGKAGESFAANVSDTKWLQKAFRAPQTLTFDQLVQMSRRRRIESE